MIAAPLLREAAGKLTPPVVSSRGPFITSLMSFIRPITALRSRFANGTRTLKREAASSIQVLCWLLGKCGLSESSSHTCLAQLRSTFPLISVDLFTAAEEEGRKWKTPCAARNSFLFSGLTTAFACRLGADKRLPLQPLWNGPPKCPHKTINKYLNMVHLQQILCFN